MAARGIITRGVTFAPNGHGRLAGTLPCGATAEVWREPDGRVAWTAPWGHGWARGGSLVEQANSLVFQARERAAGSVPA